MVKIFENFKIAIAKNIKPSHLSRDLAQIGGGGYRSKHFLGSIHL